MRLVANGNVTEVVHRGPQRGPALVFLHYFGGSSREWAGVMDKLDGEHRCIAPDLRGFGQSGAPATGYAVSDYAADVAALVRRFELEEYHLVGHSMGGKVALAFAARGPPGLEGIVLLAPSPPTPEPIGAAERARLLASHGDRAAALASIRAITAVPPDDATLDLLAEDAVRCSPIAWQAWLRCGSREDISALMPDVAAPVLVVAGSLDPNLRPDLLEREVVGRVAGARLIVLPGAGHLLPIEAPAAVADLIQAHVRSINAS